MSNVELNPIRSSYASTTVLNDNFERIEDGFKDALSRTGKGPNQMESVLDMNKNPIINLPKADRPGMPVTYDQLDPGTQEVVVVPVGPDELTDDPELLKEMSNKILVEDGGTIQQAVAVAATPSDLLASTAQYKVGSTIRTANGFIYEVAPADASDAHVETAGGVKLYVMADGDGSYNVAAFGAVSDGVTDDFDAVKAAWEHCLANGKSLYFPAGVYLVSGARNFPFRNEGAALLDCKNITIFGDGPNTILKTTSSAGADVLQLNNVKNLHFRNLKVTAELTGFAGAGSNGISITGGFDNITIDQVWCENLPYVDKGTYLDGGKAFTIQPGTPTLECGSVTARVYAKGCVYGAGLEVNLANWATKKHAIEVDIVAEDCYVGVIYSAGAATSALSAGMTSGFRVRGQAINCQQSVVASRAHGVDIDVNVITTKSAAARRLNPWGNAWKTGDNLVTGLIATYAKNSRIRVVGDIGGCDTKAQIGGATAGSSGLGGDSRHSEFFVELAGTASVADIVAISSGGNIASECLFLISPVTTTNVPADFYNPALKNTIVLGDTSRLVNSVVAGTLGFSFSDGKNVYNTIERDLLGLYFRQIGGSSNDIVVLGVKNHSGDKKFVVRNDGALGTANRISASSVGSIIAVTPVYSEDGGALIGYLPIYSSYT